MKKALYAAAQALLKNEKYPIIAIDGRCAAGKSTLARELAERFGFGIVHMDDFFLPFDMRSPGRLAEPGGNLHRERFLEEVVPKLGSAFDYGVFDCSDGTVKKRRAVPAGGVIVEGSYSMHTAFGDIYDLCVFMDISPDLQRERIISRDGEEWWPNFRDHWIPMEESYHRSMNVRARSDILINAEQMMS